MNMIVLLFKFLKNGNEHDNFTFTGPILVNSKVNAVWINRPASVLVHVLFVLLPIGWTLRQFRSTCKDKCKTIMAIHCMAFQL